MSQRVIGRKIDALGRVVLPSALRQRLNLNEGDELQVLEYLGGILLVKNVPCCLFCCRADNRLTEFKGRAVCAECLYEIKRGKVSAT